MHVNHSSSVSFFADDFSRRHIGPDSQQIQQMLTSLGTDSLDQLIQQALPQDIFDQNLQLPEPLAEHEALAALAEHAQRNRRLYSMIGMGYTNTIMPAVIRRNLLSNPGWYTAYTPYQAEIAQGRLELLLNFQQMVTDLTGMDIANASLLDEATAAAEAMTMALRAGRKPGKGKDDTIFVDQHCHPQTIAVLRTRASGIGIKVVTGNPLELTAEHMPMYFAVLVQYPNTQGAVHDFRHLAQQCHTTGSLLIMATDLMSLLLLESPGSIGADITLGSAQNFGVPMGYGGPHAAFFACKDAYKRFMPGRIVGVSKDKYGQSALRLALQTREQHIRREKATSNICTSQVLLAVINACYAIYHGPQGLQQIAARIHAFTNQLYVGINMLGWPVVHAHFFNTLTIHSAAHTESILARATEHGINLRRVDAAHLGITLDELTRTHHIQKLLACFNRTEQAIDPAYLSDHTHSGIPKALARRTAYLEHPVFNSYHAETDMMRYLNRLVKKDIALNHSMIPLGSCTMKLNAATEMEPITWPDFSDIHPFCPANQASGYKAVIDELSEMLCRITGFHAVSMQPNSGAQGEYAGLMAIKTYLASKQEQHRDICLILESAHGTNPASAVMCGFTVVFVRCGVDGQIDLEDLQAKAEQHQSRLAALMITYPSTYGIYDVAIRQVCRIIHDCGGQVYMDGANLNALVGVAKPATIGADVMHINLHKTFCIPHGGGGPGMGPIGVAPHLQNFLPNHPVVDMGIEQSFGSVSAAPWGSADILLISWMYIRMMGAKGLQKATAVAVLNANYIATQLKAYYPILYTGQNNRVAHECIIDLRPIKQESGITEEDIAKRLIDYGFHAPTMSFPVAGTLMIEPTESESLPELDRFITAMIAIRKEITEVQQGTYTLEDNPLVHAPHSMHDIMAESWTHSYSKKQAVYPLAFVQENKYWCPVNRIDNVYGDRNLFCSCLPHTSYN